MTQKARHVFISGHVQGVGYRYSTSEKARSLNLTGWVRNLIDGRVEALFEGTESDVNKMITWCRKGPSLAHVTEVKVSEKPVSGALSFEILR